MIPRYSEGEFAGRLRMGDNPRISAATPAVYKVRPEGAGSGHHLGAEAARDGEESALRAAALLTHAATALSRS